MLNILTELVDKQTLKYGDREAFSSLVNGEWKPTSWNEFNYDVNTIACALEILGVKEFDNLAVFSANRPEILVTDFASYYNRAVPISIYATSSYDQVKYIINDAGVEILFVGNDTQYDIALKALDECPTLRQIIIYDDIKRRENDKTTLLFSQLMKLGESATVNCRDEVKRRRKASMPDDTATIIYTSGTTGEPKGAILPHSNFNAAMLIHRDRLTMLNDNDTSVCFLPLSHIFEKAWSYFCLYMGMKISINLDPREIQSTVKNRRPTCMCSVPRFWEKAYTAIQEKLGSMSVLD